MNKTCVIIGDSRGLGNIFKKHFESKAWNIIGFNSSTGLDAVIDKSIDCDLFINNAYINGKQIDFVNALHNSVKKMIVCGSVAAFYPDPKLPTYSHHKKILVERIRELSNPNIFLLHLSSKAYNNPTVILNLIDLWLEQSIMTEVFFDPRGKPNE